MDGSSSTRRMVLLVACASADPSSLSSGIVLLQHVRWTPKLLSFCHDRERQNVSAVYRIFCKQSAIHTCNELQGSQKRLRSGTLPPLVNGTRSDGDLSRAARAEYP